MGYSTGPAASPAAGSANSALHAALRKAVADRTDAVRVTGGASVSREVCQVLADVFNARLERLETENSAGLGAALRAAQATGAGEWQRLTDAFCRPVAGQSVSPLAANVEVYRRQLPAFEAFARQGRGGQSLPHA